MWAASVGTYLPGWRGLGVVSIPVVLVSVLGILEFAGLVPHVPFFEDGSDPGLYRSATFVTGMPFVFLAHTIMIFLGSSYLSGRLAAREVEFESEKQAKWVLLGQYSGAVAHAVKNSLAAIKGLAFVLEKDSTLPEPRRAVAGSIVRETERLNAAVSRYLSLTKNEPPALRAVSPSTGSRKFRTNTDGSHGTFGPMSAQASMGPIATLFAGHPGLPSFRGTRDSFPGVPRLRETLVGVVRRGTSAAAGRPRG